MLAGGRSFFPSTKALRLPITKDILIAALTVTPPNSITWMPFLKLHGPVLCAWENRLIRLLKRAMRLLLRLTDVTFSEQDQYATLSLKRSKTDVNHAGVLIVIAATNHSTCPVTLYANCLHMIHSLHTPRCLLSIILLFLTNMLWIALVQGFSLLAFPTLVFPDTVSDEEQHSTRPIMEC